MLRINRQTDYAVRVLLALAKHGDEARLPTPAIQKEMLVPKAMMPRTVAALAKAQLVKTYPGRDGGIMLARPAAEISLRDVVEAFEGPILLSQCLEARDEKDCPFRTNCPVSPKWGRVQIAILRELARISFEALALEAQGAPIAVLGGAL